MHLAMVHGAVYDAVNAIDGTREAYLYDPASVPAGASKAAAASQAAHDVLIGLIPASHPTPTVVRDRIDAMLAASLTGITAGLDDGKAIGAAAAAAMLAARTGDGRFGSKTFAAGRCQQPCWASGSWCRPAAPPART